MHPVDKVFETLQSIPPENTQVMAPFLGDEEEGDQQIMPMEWTEENKEKLRRSASLIGNTAKEKNREIS